MELSQEAREYFKSQGKLGGIKRLATTTPEQRKRWARKGGYARALNEKLRAQAGLENADREGQCKSTP